MKDQTRKRWHLSGDCGICGSGDILALGYGHPTAYTTHTDSTLNPEQSRFWLIPPVHSVNSIREGVKKKRIYLGLCPKLWVGGSKGGSKVPNFFVKITIQLFLLQTSRNVLKHVIHKWGGHIWPFHDALRPQRLFSCWVVFRGTS